MKKVIISLYIIFGALISSSVYSFDGPHLSDGAPKARISTDRGDLQIFGLPDSANCYKNKAVQSRSSYEIQNMILSVVLAARESQSNVNFWVERYDTTVPQRCSLSFIEIAD